MSPKDAIIEKAAELGFPIVGFTDSAHLLEAKPYYQKWIDEGMSGGMISADSDIDARLNPKSLLKSAESVIVFGMPHNVADPRVRENELRIARYARGYDYHEVIKIRLTEAAEFIRMIFPEAEFAFSVDTAQFAEKAAAIRAGIAWQGRNSLLINRRYGSFFCIGIIITNIKFEIDSPAENLCSSCRACIEACPTGAIEAEIPLINSDLCLAYWLNEGSRKYPVPAKIRNKIGNRLFGCDTCQDVCPFNKIAPLSEEKAFYPRLNRAGLTRKEVNALSQDDFARRFKKSPVKRAKLKGLRDNAGLPREKPKN